MFATDEHKQGVSVVATSRALGPCPGPRSSCATVRFMSRDVSVRELRNHTAEVLRRVEAGERLRVTVDRRPVAELAPLPARSAWVPRGRAVTGLVQADARLRGELAEVLPDTVDEL
jgi:prevent-host-death family protein